MPPKRKKKQPTQKQKQSQRQSVVVNIGKSSTTKRRRNAGRGGLPPPSHLQNLFPPTIIQQQAPNIAVLENQISRLTSLIQEKPHIPALNTPLSADTRTAEAQRLAGEQAEARRPGPTAGNFQAPPSRARALSQDLEGFEDEPTPSAISSIPTDFFKSEFSFEGSDLSMPLSMRKRPPSEISSIPTDFFKTSSIRTFNEVRQPDPVFNQRLVNPADPPKMTGLGEGGGGLPFAESRRAGPGAPRKDTQRAIPVSPPTADPVQADGTPIIKKETKAQKTKREKAEKAEAQKKGQKVITDFV